MFFAFAISNAFGNEVPRKTKKTIILIVMKIIIMKTLKCFAPPDKWFELFYH